MNKKQSRFLMYNLFIDFCEKLTMVLCALRSCDTIDWDWYWVIFPILIPWGSALIFLIISGWNSFSNTFDKYGR